MDAAGGDVGSKYVLGVMYLKGYRIAKDIGAGMALLKSARRNGHAESRLLMFLMEKKGTSEIRDHFPTIKELRQEYDPRYALNEEQFLDALGGVKGVSGKDLKKIIESPPAVLWDSLSEKPAIREPNYFEQQNSTKPRVSPAPADKTFVDVDKPSSSSGSSGLFDDVLKDTSERNSTTNASPVTSSVGVVAAGVFLAFACCYSLFWLLGKTVQGLTPVATGRRWMNWVVFLALMQPLTKFFSRLIGGYGNPVNVFDVFAQGLVGAVVLGFTAFVVGALWSRFRPKPQQQTVTIKNPELEQIQSGWHADGFRMNSASIAIQTKSTTIPKSNNDISNDQTKLTETVVSELVRAPISATVPTADEESYWAAAMAEVESGQRRPGVWAKAFAEADGDEAKAKAAYLKVRVQQMSLS